MFLSALGQFILWLHKRAQQAGRITVSCEEATQVLEALYGGMEFNLTTRMKTETKLRHKFEGLTDAQIAGLELRRGRPRNELAKKIQRVVINQIRSLDLVLCAVDELGYTPLLIRSLLQNHYWELRRHPLGSDAYVVYADLNHAINRATDKTKIVAFFLIAGCGPQEIGAVLKTNGSRRIGKAMAELSRILEGKTNRGRR